MEGVDEATAALIASLLAEDNPYETEEEEGGDPGDVEWDLEMEARKSRRKAPARRVPRMKPASAKRSKREKGGSEPREGTESIPKSTSQNNGKFEGGGPRRRTNEEGTICNFEEPEQNHVCDVGETWNMGDLSQVRIRGSGVAQSRMPLDEVSLVSPSPLQGDTDLQLESTERPLEQYDDDARENRSESEAVGKGNCNRCVRANEVLQCSPSCVRQLDSKQTPKEGSQSSEPGQITNKEILQIGDSCQDPSLEMDGRTEYARRRPQRAIAAKQRYDFVEPREQIDLIPPRDFVGVPGSKFPDSQPYRVSISSDAALLMDFHAHLSLNEVIGLVAGEWDPVERYLSVIRAFPCKNAAGAESTVSTEIDPTSEVETRAVVHSLGLRVVGWYHSHPVFAPFPSHTDIKNQFNYQKLFRDEEHDVEPFFGIIIGPYDIRLPTESSKVAAFCVQNCSMGLIPRTVVYEKLQSESMPDDGIKSVMIQLVEEYASNSKKVDFRGNWRPYQTFISNKPAGGHCTRLGKLRSALCSHLPDSKSSDWQTFFHTIVLHIQSSWKIDLGYT